MNRDDFLDGLKSSYFEEIHKCVYESEEKSGERIDYSTLQKKISDVWKEAKAEGIKWEEFGTWVQESIPEHFESLPEFKNKKVA